jgi:hypothetical protein
VVSAPVIFKGRELTTAEQAQWAVLDREFAPYVIGDKAGDGGTVELPPIANLSWCGLYSLAVYFMAELPASIVPGQALLSPGGLKFAQWQELTADFWARRSNQLEAFRNFLNDWGLGKVFGLRNVRFSEYSDSPWKEDRKVLGMHLFHKDTDVSDYVLRWKTNPLIHDTHLWQQRITISRTVDLICSELLGNGFEHNGIKEEDAEVFIMAKLCSHQSAWKALELNEKRSYLTETEVKCFRLARKHEYPILQLCIGDNGQGFGGNADLRERFLAEYPQKADTFGESDLIALALSGKVTTKTPEHYRAFWKTHISGEEKAIPAIHGLSEVRRCVQRENGFWRIHSNSTAVEYDFLPDESGRSNLRPEISKSARPIIGCLHYFMLPLLLEEHRPSPVALRTPASGQGLTLIDAANYALQSDPGQARMKLPNQWVGPLCDHIINAKNRHSGPLLVNLRIFDELDNSDLEIACLDFVHCLYRVRDDLAVFICGASAKTKYQLRRYSTGTELNLEYRILPFIDFNEEGNVIELGCSDKVAGISSQLTAVLMGDTSSEILKSSEPQWAIYHNVCAQNLALFHIKPVSLDEAFCARFLFSLSAIEEQTIIFGGCTFPELELLLDRHRAIAPASPEGYFRLGDTLSTYIHLGRLWADLDFQFRATNWLRVAMLRAQGTKDVPVDNNLVLLAVLHPAIELVHELIRNPPFSNAEIIEIHRVSDLRWDFEPLLRLRGRHVAIVTDVILTGRSVQKIKDALEYLGISVSACFSLLSVKEHAVSVREFTYCECSRDDLLNAAKKKKTV